MNAVIEVAAIEVTVMVSVISPKVKVQKTYFPEVAALKGIVATSVLRALRQGRSSQNAVSPVNSHFEGGLAVA